VFFAVSKIFSFFTEPSNILITAAILGTALLFTRWARIARRLLVVAMLVIVVVGFLPVGTALVGVLEDRFPPWDASRGAPTGFIVLGGAIDPERSAARHTPAIGRAAERITIVAELARHYPDAKIIYSSGSAALFGGPAEADYVLSLFESFGIPPGRIILERKSRNTQENATFSKVLAAPKFGDRWVVITSAAHMPRAIGSFRAAGFDVEAFPVDWQTRGPEDLLNVAFVADRLETIDDAAHEYVGLLMYRLTGRSSELFPGPR
jgi:uncharacterized SAM-binding protein YcdF (DUF218 family)